MDKLYEFIEFINRKRPAINATNLNKISRAVDELDDRTILLDSVIQSFRDKSVIGMEYYSGDGKIGLFYGDGSSKEIGPVGGVDCIKNTGGSLTGNLDMTRNDILNPSRIKMLRNGLFAPEIDMDSDVSFELGVRETGLNEWLARLRFSDQGEISLIAKANGLPCGGRIDLTDEIELANVDRKVEIQSRGGSLDVATNSSFNVRATGGANITGSTVNIRGNNGEGPLIRVSGNEFILETPGGATIYSTSAGQDVTIRAPRDIQTAASETASLSGGTAELIGETGSGARVRVQNEFSLMTPGGADIYSSNGGKNINIKSPESTQIVTGGTAILAGNEAEMRGGLNEGAKIKAKSENIDLYAPKKIALTAHEGIEGSADAYGGYPSLSNIAFVELKSSIDDEEMCNIDAEWICTRKSGYAIVIEGLKRKGIAIDTDAGGASLTPFYDQSGQMDLGSSTLRWRNIYASNGTIQTSDRNEKNNVAFLSANKARDFVMGLQPVSYKMNSGTSDRTHWGLIAQDVEELLEKLGIDSKDFAGFIKSPKVILHDTDESGEPLRKPRTEVIEGEYDYSLRYDEFIAPMIKTIQNLNERLERLENK